ncbi:uncharacterized protein LOC143905368 [Temnothorax americanus]|uniref:uncharacterized protein LOC143905368 n=1 Tax=Temnothorax americanus TaxID=1964332 RepID=UPI004067DB1A
MYTNAETQSHLPVSMDLMIRVYREQFFDRQNRALLHVFGSNVLIIVRLLLSAFTRGAGGVVSDIEGASGQPEKKTTLEEEEAWGLGEASGASGTTLRMSGSAAQRCSPRSVGHDRWLSLLPVAPWSGGQRVVHVSWLVTSHPVSLRQVVPQSFSVSSAAAELRVVYRTVGFDIALARKSGRDPTDGHVPQPSL